MVLDIAEKLDITKELKKFPYEVSGDRNKGAHVPGAGEPTRNCCWQMSLRGFGFQIQRDVIGHDGRSERISRDHYFNGYP